MAQKQEPRSTHGRLALEQQHGTTAFKEEQSLQHQRPCGGLVEIVLQGENVVGLLESWLTFLSSLPFYFIHYLPSPPRLKTQQSFDDAGLRAASPSYGLYDDDGDSDDDEDSIIVSNTVAHPLRFSLLLLSLTLSLIPVPQTEQEGVLEASHGTFSLESSLPEDFLNLFSIM